MSQFKKIKPGWKSLVGLEEWKAEFDTLLTEATIAANAEDTASRLKIASFLVGFIQESAPQSDEMDQIDDLARRLATDILQTEIDQRIASIASRTAEYTALTKTLDTAASKAEAAAGSIRLERVTGLIQSATETVNSAKALADTLDNGKASERKIAELIEETAESITKLRSAVGKLL